MKPLAAQLVGCVCPHLALPWDSMQELGQVAEPPTFPGRGDEEHLKSPWAVRRVRAGAEPAGRVIF